MTAKLQWLVYASSDPLISRVFVRPADIRGVKETNDGHAVLLLDGGGEVDVAYPALAILATISNPPDPPTMNVGPVSSPVAPPTFSGSASFNATVLVRDGGQLVAQTKADTTGEWSVVGPPLTPGEHSFSATQTDIFGLVSAATTPVDVTVAAPAPPTPPPEPETPPPAPPAAPPEPEASAAEEPAAEEPHS